MGYGFIEINLEEWIKNEIVATAVQHMHDNKKEYFVSSTVSVRDSEKQSSAEISDEKIINSTETTVVVCAPLLINEKSTTELVTKKINFVNSRLKLLMKS